MPHLLLGLAAIALLSLLDVRSAHADPGSAYWVFFADRPATDAELAARERELDPRAIARRLRTLGRAVDRDDLAPSAGYVQRVVSTGARVRKLSRWLNAVSVDADAAQLEQLRALPEVRRIAPLARYVRRSDGDALPDGPPQEPGTVRELRLGAAAADVDYGRARAQLTQLGAPTAHACGLTGKGVVVGILDSGFLTTHAALQKVKVLAAHDFVKNDEVVANEMGDPAGQHGHGTSCLSLIAAWDPGNFVGGAYDVSVLLAKTEDTAREVMTEEDNYVAGLEWVEGKGADVATSSLGYSDWWKPEDFDGMTAPSSIAVGAAVQRGLVCLTAVGNEGPQAKTLGVPADALGVIGIGAVNLSGRIANFSSRGPTADGRIKPELVAPGQGVTVARASGGYMTGDGTSYATPLAAAMVALLLQAKPTLTPAEVLEILKSSAVSGGPPDSTYGYGRIDIAKATAPFCQCAPNCPGAAGAGGAVGPATAGMSGAAGMPPAAGSGAPEAAGVGGSAGVAGLSAPTAGEAGAAAGSGGPAVSEEPVRAPSTGIKSQAIASSVPTAGVTAPVAPVIAGSPPVATAASGCSAAGAGDGDAWLVIAALGLSRARRRPAQGQMRSSSTDGETSSGGAGRPRWWLAWSSKLPPDAS